MLQCRAWYIFGVCEIVKETLIFNTFSSVKSSISLTLGNRRRTNLGVIQEQDIFNNSKVYHSFSASDGGPREVVCQLSVPRGWLGAVGCLHWTCSFVLVDCFGSSSVVQFLASSCLSKDALLPEIVNDNHCNSPPTPPHKRKVSKIQPMVPNHF